MTDNFQLTHIYSKLDLTIGWVWFEGIEQRAAGIIEISHRIDPSLALSRQYHTPQCERKKKACNKEPHVTFFLFLKGTVNCPVAVWLIW